MIHQESAPVSDVASYQINLVTCLLFCESLKVWLFQALRKLSGVVNRISTIIPNSSDVSPSITLDSGSRHHATGSNVEGWTDEDALKIDVITNRTRQV